MWNEEFVEAWSMVDPKEKSDFYKDIIYWFRFLQINAQSVGKEYQKWLEDRQPGAGKGYPEKMQQLRDKLNNIFVNKD